MTDIRWGDDGIAYLVDVPDPAPHSEPFSLQRPTQRDRHIKPTFGNQFKRQQGVLFSGGDCLDGQQDLPFTFAE